MREALATEAARRIEGYQEAIGAAAVRYVDRVQGVVTARLRSPKHRKHTRYWEARGTEGKSAHPAAPVQFKALDPEAIVPATLIEEGPESLRQAVTEVAHDAASDARERIIGGTSDTGGMFEVDEGLLGDLIDEALEDLLGAAERYAAELRTAILDNDRDDVELTDLVDTVGEAARRGGRWLELNARTVATALGGKAALEQARALGVTHAQWISRRDPQVRPSHVRADGQVREIGEAFTVGAHQLEYPGDPSGLPATAAEVHNCRCALLMADPDDAFHDAVMDIMDAALDATDQAAARELVEAAATSTLLGPTPDAPELTGPVQMLPAPDDVVAWRLLDAPLDATPGQQLTLSAGTALGLAAPDELTVTVLSVLIPRGTLVGVTGGAVVLGEAATVQVLASGAGGTQGRII